MRAYMKSELPFLGINAPQLTLACRECFPRLSLPTAEAWRGLILDLWRGARFREERYAAIRLADAGKFAAFRTPKAVPMLEEMIVSGAWWDYVDHLAARVLGDIVARYPKELKPLMRRWAVCPDMWKRRSSILCQLKFKKETDLELLYYCIEPSLDSGEFFLRKAIGWALREYAKTDPAEVRRCVRERGGRLSGLSRREALKNIG